MSEHDPTTEQMLERAVRDMYLSSVRNHTFRSFTRHVEVGYTEYTVRLSVAVTNDDYVSPEDQKRNDAMERGDELRDRAKDEK